MKDYAIGIDIGTTSAKVVLFDESGEVTAYHSKSYPLLAEEPGAAEQNPDEIYEAVVHSLKETVKKSGDKADRIGFLSFSTAMHTLIAVDDNGAPLTNSFTWADTRSEPFVMEAKENGLADDIYTCTGVPVHPMTPLFKLMWLKHESPDIFQKAAKFVGIKDYILFRWFGDWKTDYASAAATGLWNLTSLQWDEKLMNMANVTIEKLPEIKPATYYWESLSEEIGKGCGLGPEVKVVIGSTDGPLSNLGVGAISPGDVAVTIGTSGAIRTTTPEPILDPEGRTFCYPLTENHWVSGGPVNNGGLAFQWVHDLLEEKKNEKDSYEMLSKLAEKSPAGAEGLLFLPHLTGERAPLWDAQAKGSFIGLTLRHEKDDLLRAVLEGTILNLFDVYNLVKTQTAAEAEIKIFATGGFTQSAIWKQILADVFQKEVSIPENTESSCLGAVLLGRYAVGLTSQLHEVKEETKQYETIQPNKENREVYQELFRLYQALSQALKPNYKGLNEFQNKHKKESGQ